VNSAVYGWVAAPSEDVLPWREISETETASRRSGWLQPRQCARFSFHRTSSWALRTERRPGAAFRAFAENKLAVNDVGASQAKVKQETAVGVFANQKDFLPAYLSKVWRLAGSANGRGALSRVFVERPPGDGDELRAGRNIRESAYRSVRRSL
jgi:hypothetical protein